MTNTEKPDGDALRERLASLEICVAKNKEGVFTVYTKAEPLFCYDATSLEEADKLVRDTLESYARTFFDVENLRLGTSSSPAKSAIPSERVTPVARITPVFDLAA